MSIDFLKYLHGAVFVFECVLTVQFTNTKQPAPHGGPGTVAGVAGPVVIRSGLALPNGPPGGFGPPPPARVMAVSREKSKKGKKIEPTITW